MMTYQMVLLKKGPQGFRIVHDHDFEVVWVDRLRPQRVQETAHA